MKNNPIHLTTFMMLNIKKILQKPLVIFYNNETQESLSNGNNAHGYFKGSEETVEDLKDIVVNVKKDIKYYAALSGGAHARMEILHNINKRNGHTLENNIGTIDCFDGASYQIFEKSKKMSTIINFSSKNLEYNLLKEIIQQLVVKIY